MDESVEEPLLSSTSSGRNHRRTFVMEESYHRSAGFIFVFNLIVGTGALALPKAWSNAGWLLSLIILLIIAFVSFITVTFVVEAISISNALLKANNRKCQDDCKEVTQDDSHRYDITQRVEMGAMASLCMPVNFVRFFYAALAVYLYGDLIIYCVAISKSLRDVSCGIHNQSEFGTANMTDLDPCWTFSSEYNISRSLAYKIFIGAVLIFLCPFAYFVLSKTKLLQILTALFRWTSFVAMIVLAIIALSTGKGQGDPPAARISGLPNLFGIGVYSFMCHHSIPSLVTPINQKKKIHLLLGLDYVLILLFYILLSMTGSYTFEDLNDLYTLNFEKASPGKIMPVPRVAFLEYFLPLFPVFTLGTSFPIIAITLTRNLKALLLPLFNANSLTTESRGMTSSWIIDRLVFPSLAVLPPVFLSLITDNIQMLVGVIGSYAGACIQYIIPAFLILYARRKESSLSFPLSDEEMETKDNFVSPFKSRIWIYIVLAWCLISIIFVTIDHIVDH